MNSLSLNITQLIMFLIESMIYDSTYMVITTINCTRGNDNVLII